MHSPIDLARAAVADNPRGIAGVAKAIGFSRTALSLYLGGKYSAPETIERAILGNLDTRLCPHTQQEISKAICQRRALAPQPYGGTARLAQWNACQACPMKPTKE